MSKPRMPSTSFATAADSSPARRSPTTSSISRRAQPWRPTRALTREAGNSPGPGGGDRDRHSGASRPAPRMGSRARAAGPPGAATPAPACPQRGGKVARARLWVPPPARRSPGPIGPGRGRGDGRGRGER
eukprot:7388991-Prymnesium_polylepis.1